MGRFAFGVVVSVCCCTWPGLCRAEDAPGVHFAFSLETIAGEIDYHKHGAAIASDADGNTYITGWISGTVDFDPGPEVHSLDSSLGENSYIAKYDPNGAFLWVVPLMGTYAWAIALDPDRNVYVAGQLVDTVDYDPGPGVTMVSPADGIHSSVLAAKFSTDGEFVWVKVWGSDDYCEGSGIAVDGNGDVLVTGEFRETVDFDPGAGVFEVDNAGVGSGTGNNPDVFVSKLDADGNFIWVKVFSHDVTSADVAIDSDNNILVCGDIPRTRVVDFDPGAGEAIPDTSLSDTTAYICKLDSDGNFVWLKTFADTGVGFSRCVSYKLAADYENNVVMAGEFSNKIDFDPGAGEAVESVDDSFTPSYTDFFVVKLDADGNFQWVRHAGSAAQNRAECVAVDNLGNVYLTGGFQKTVDFNFGQGETLVQVAGDIDIFVLKFTAAGEYVWHMTVGGPEDDIGYGISVDPLGTPSITGVFKGIAELPVEEGDASGDDDEVVALSKSVGGAVAKAKKSVVGGGDLISRFGRPKNLRPVAVIDNSGPTLLAPGGTVDFSGAGSFDPDGELMTYVWDFDNGNREELGAGGAFPPTETFTAPGRYASKLQVIDRLTKRSFVASSDVVVVGDDDDSQLYAKSAKFSVDRVRPDNDKFAIKGALNRRYLPADLSGVSLSIDLEGVAAGGPVTLDAKGGFKAPKGTGGITAVKLASKNGAYSIALSATDLSSILPVPDVSAKGLLGIAVTLHLSGGGLAAPYDLEGRFEFKFASKKGQKASGSYSFTRNPAMSGTFLGTSVKAKADKAGTGFTVTAKGAFKPVGNQLPEPTDDVTVEIGTQSVTLPQAQVLVGSDGSLTFSNKSGAADTLKSLQLTVKSGKFSLQSNVLTGTGLTADPTGAVLLIRITVPTTFGDLTYETEAQL